MILIKNIERKDFYINFYKSLNFVLNLSNKELAILSYFARMRANLPRELTSLQKDAITFNSVNRKIVSQSLGISIFNLNNYIKSLKTKGLLIDTGKRMISISPKIWVDIDVIESTYSNEYKFNIV